MNKGNHNRKDIEQYFKNERRRFIKFIAQVNKRVDLGRSIVHICKRRICSRKYKTKGILEYRSGNNFKAIQYLLRAKSFYKSDGEITTLILKSFCPKFIRSFLIKIVYMKYGAKQS